MPSLTPSAQEAPQVEPARDSDLPRLIFEAIGQASMCWKPRPSTEVFDTDEANLKRAGYQVGPENDRYILEACAMGDGKVVCAWGANAKGLSRPAEVLRLIRSNGYTPMALGFTKDRLPRHPLMLPYKTPLEAM